MSRGDPTNDVCAPRRLLFVKMLFGVTTFRLFVLPLSYFIIYMCIYVMYYFCARTVYTSNDKSILSFLFFFSTPASNRPLPPPWLQYRIRIVSQIIVFEFITPVTLAHITLQPCGDRCLDPRIGND